jgi:hypothetical protein
MNEFILANIPNWNRFCEKYKPKKVFMHAFEERIELIEDEELKVSVSKKINVDLGILLLAHKEVNEWVFGEILQSIKEKKVD